MVVARSGELVMERQDMSNSDILEVNVEWQGWKFKLVLVYLDARDGERNLKIKSKLENIVGAVDEEGDLILLGDFNAHVGIVWPQELNRNGQLLLDLMET